MFVSIAGKRGAITQSHWDADEHGIMKRFTTCEPGSPREETTLVAAGRLHGRDGEADRGRTRP
jgi:hypothetical protein